MLEAQHLTKTFGELIAVNDVSFDIESGNVLGLIGQNGSGKTTMFRLILGFLQPEGNGTVHWNGEPIKDEITNIIGYLPEERGLYPELTIEKQLLYFARLSGMKDKEILEKIDIWMDKFAVKGNRKDKIKTLSKGNQQKIQVIATLIHEPKLLILDEPFSGLDPVNATLLQEGIIELRDKGSCIIFSSHNMNNVEEMCDKLLMIHNGNRVLYGEVNEVRESFGRTRLYIETPHWSYDALSQLEGVEKVEDQDNDNYLLHLSDAAYGEALFEQLTQGQYISKFMQLPPTLNEIFKMKAGEAHE